MSHTHGKLTPIMASINPIHPVAGAVGTIPDAFVFQRRSERVDWRNLASLDLDHVIRTLDVDALQRHLANTTFCDIRTENLQGVDANFVKLFELAQLTLEYVLFAQEHLAAAKAVTELNLDNVTKELNQLHETHGALKKESKRRKHMLASYQKLVDTKSVGPHKCHYCSKSFISMAYLINHCERRHSEHSPFQFPSTDASGTKHETITNSNIFKEVQQLKRDINQLNSQNSANAEDAALETRRLRNEITQLQLDIDSRKRLEEESNATWTQRLHQQETVMKTSESRYRLELEELRERMASEQRRMQHQVDQAREEVAARDEEIAELRKQLRATSIQLKNVQDQGGTSVAHDGVGGEDKIQLLQEMIQNLALQIKGGINETQLVPRKKRVSRTSKHIPATDEAHNAQVKPSVEKVDSAVDAKPKEKPKRNDLTNTKNSEDRPNQSIPRGATSNGRTEVAKIANVTTVSASVTLPDHEWKQMFDSHRSEAVHDVENSLADSGLNPASKRLSSREFKAQLRDFEYRQQNVQQSSPYYAKEISKARTELKDVLSTGNVGRFRVKPKLDEFAELFNADSVVSGQPAEVKQFEDSAMSNDPFDISRPKLAVDESEKPQFVSTPNPAVAVSKVRVPVESETKEQNSGSSFSSSLTVSDSDASLQSADPIPPPRDDPPIPYPRVDSETDSGSIVSVSDEEDDEF